MSESNRENVGYWQDRVFDNFIRYCIPISLLAIIPAIIYTSYSKKYDTLFFDVTCFFLLLIVSKSKGISRLMKKTMVIALCYCLGVYLNLSMGYPGAGLLYILITPIVAALILPIIYCFVILGINFLTLLSFIFIITYQVTDIPLIHQYKIYSWLNVSGSLIFLSLILVLMIKFIFKNLNITLIDKALTQKNYQTIFDFNPQPMWLFDPESLLILKVNDAAVQQYGYSKEEFEKLKITDIRPETEQDNVVNIVEENKNIGKAFSGIFIHTTKLGDLITVNVQSNVINYNGKEVKLVLATDITEKLEIQKKIEDSEFNLRSIFESALEGFTLVDEKYCVKVFNKLAKELLESNINHQKQLQAGCNIFNYIDLKSLEFFTYLMKKARNGHVVEYDKNFVRKDGKAYWYTITISPVYHGKQIKGVCLSARDITVIKNYFATIEKQNKNLTEIAWMQSHLFRVPVANIAALTSLLLDEHDEQQREEIIAKLKKSSNKLEDVVRQITAISEDTIGKEYYN